MKKIFRMALVFALAGATLMYTGCTKDYSEDINSVKNDVTSLESSLNALKQDVGNLQSSVSALESAYKAADAALQKSIGENADAIKALQGQVKDNADAIKTLQGQVKDNADAIAKLQEEAAKHATKDELKAAVKDLQDQIDALKKDITNKAEALQKAIDGLSDQLKADEIKLAANEKLANDNAKAIETINGILADLKDAQDNLNTVFNLLVNELRSIVFVPDFYYAGVEATEYEFAYVSPIELVKEAADRVITVKEIATEGYYEYSWAWGIWGWTPQATWVEETYKDVDTPFTLLKGEPTSVKAGSKYYSIGQIGTAYYNINPSTFDTEKADWALDGKDYDYVAKAGETWSPILKSIKNEDGVAAVKYVIENPELIATPYIAKLAESFDNEFIAALAKIQDSKKDIISVMNLSGAVKAEPARIIASDYEAIVTSPEFFKELAFVEKTYKTIFPCEIGGDDLYPNAELAILNAPSVEVSWNKGAFDFAPYIAIHMEDAKGGYETTLAELLEVYPNLTMNFETVDYTIGDFKTSQSAYCQLDGSKFIPCYVDDKGNSIPCTETEGISSVGRYPVILVTLFNGDDLVLAGYFKVEIVKDAPKPIEPIVKYLPDFDMIPFVCGSQKLATTWAQFSYYVLESLGVDYDEFVASYKWDGKTYVEKDGKMVEENKYGKIQYNIDHSGSGINNVFEWNADPQAIGEGNSQTVYTFFTSKKGDVYFGFSTSVAEAASFDFGANKIANEWYGDIDNEPSNTVRINVLVPSATNDDVTEFYRDLTHFYVGYKPAVEVAEGVDPIYKDIKLDPNSTFVFSSTQPKINGAQLVINKAGTALYANAEKAENLLATIDGSVITYATTDVAKKFLNLWSYKENEQAKMLYANIDVITTYGVCEIPAGKESFHVRFVRPLDVDFNGVDVAEESAVAGFDVEVAKFVSAIQDWNNQNVLVKDGQSLKENVIKGVNMYEYYQFKALTIDLASAKRDNWDMNNASKLGKVSEVTPDAQLTLNGASVTGNSIDITKFVNLKSAVINYKNDRAVVESFNIYLPAKIEYAWGTMDAELVIKVKPTSETSEK